MSSTTSTTNQDQQQINDDMAAYNAALDQMSQDEANLGTQDTVVGLFAGIMKYYSDEIVTLASVQNVEADLTNVASGAESAYTAMQNDYDDPTACANDAQDLMDEMDILQNFFDDPDTASMFASSTITGVQDGMDSIESAFTDEDGNSNWGNPNAMAADMNTWMITETTGTTTDENGNEVPSGGGYVPQFKQIEDGFNVISQNIEGQQQITENNENMATSMYQAAEGGLNAEMTAIGQLETTENTIPQ